MKSPRQKYNERQAKHEAIEVLAHQLLPEIRQSLRRCRTAAKQMLQGTGVAGHRRRSFFTGFLFHT